MKNVIVITGASSGFGALAARALALAGHTVYASMRETTGRCGLSGVSRPGH
jgi:NADP-dependent 3-hydroxy acid dehydrogenase YdfG